MIEPNSSARPRAGRDALWPMLGIFSYLLIVSIYFIARFGGRWAESDSGTFTSIIRAFVGEGRLVTETTAYPNGFGFQSISAFILLLSGIDISTLQQLLYPLLAAIVVLPAWVLYRELTGNTRGAAIACVLLLTQPELLFVILRSSHEKFTRMLMLLCLFLLARSFNLLDRPRLFVAHVVLFYMAGFAFIATNGLLAHSFIMAIACALAIGWVLERRVPSPRRENGRTLARLLYASLICLGLVYVFIFYLYPPAEHDFLVVKDTGERMRALFLDTQSGTPAEYTDAYHYVTIGWISLPVYFTVSIANWILLLVSFVLWVRQGLSWLWRGQAPATRGAWLMWLLYAAFAIQGVLSVFADASGALGSNLQHRLFPSFSIIAVGLVGAAVSSWRPRRFPRALSLALSAAVFCIAALSVFKATNEPELSNKWTFYRPEELSAMQWGDAHLRNTQIATEYDERLRVSYDTAIGQSKNTNYFSTYDSLEPFYNIVMSSVTRLRSGRLSAPLPLPPDALRVYDNGAAEFYHVRPQSPYQH